MQLLGFFLFTGIGLLISLATTVFWVWMLVDAIINPALKGLEKLIWVLVVLFTHIIGAVLYFLLVRSQRNRL